MSGEAPGDDASDGALTGRSDTNAAAAGARKPDGMDLAGDKAQDDQYDAQNSAFEALERDFQEVRAAPSSALACLARYPRPFAGDQNAC